MRMFWPLGSHETWRKKLDAYVDGELSGEQFRRFDTHAQSCFACAREVVERREIKQMAAALPVMPVTRSFRITPGMLVEAAPAQRRGVPLVTRMAQMTAGLATLAFAATLVLDLASSGGDEQAQRAQPASAGDALSESAAMDDDLASPAASSTQALDSGSASPNIPEASDATIGGQAVEPTPDPSQYDSAGRGSATPGAQAPEPPRSDGAEGKPAGGEMVGTANLASDESDDDDTGVSTLLVAEIALGALAFGSAGTWLATRRR